MAVRIRQDYTNDLAAHSSRMNRFVEAYKRWRNRPQVVQAGEEQKVQFNIPVTQWQVFGKWAKAMSDLFGDDAEIIAQPTGPSDEKNVTKVGRYMTWRLFSSMKATRDVGTFLCRSILFGRAHAYRPWRTKSFDTPAGRKVYYDGPCFEPLWPDDLIVPAEDARSIHDFSHVIRKFRATPQQLLDGEREGRYFGIRDQMEKIFAWSLQINRERETYGDEVKQAKDEGEGVTYEGVGVTRGKLPVYEWYGRWRLPKGERGAGSGEADVELRELDETELVVRYLPDLHQVIGVHRLMDMYPMMERRRPFAECTIACDGSYWPMGLAELLESVEHEATTNHRLFTEAGEFSVGPLIFARPANAAQLTDKRFKYEPYTICWTEDPAGVRVVDTRPNMEYSLAKENQVLAVGERVTGVSDQALGRGSDRPNAPRTARGQMIIAEQGNVRADLDMQYIREALGELCEDIWALDRQFTDDERFFRVTEEEAKGLFQVAKGGAAITAEEFNADYDFRIKFATSAWDRQHRNEMALQRYQIDLTNPLVANNPLAMWTATAAAHKALGDSNFASIVPKPPVPDVPVDPKEEWTRMLQGEQVDVNPMDNDDLHLVKHFAQLERNRKSPSYDSEAANLMMAHLQEHYAQKKQKQLMQAMLQQAAGMLAGNAMQGLQAQAGGAGPVQQQMQSAIAPGMAGGNSQVEDGQEAG